MCKSGGEVAPMPSPTTATEIRALQEQMGRQLAIVRQEMEYNQYVAYLGHARTPADYQPEPKPEPPDPEAVRFSKLQLD